jgi:hypothetical protein
MNPPSKPPQSDDIVWHKTHGPLPRNEEGEDEARGAYLNGRVLWVLVISMVATVVAFVAVWAFAMH